MNHETGLCDPNVFRIEGRRISRLMDEGLDKIGIIYREKLQGLSKKSQNCITR